MDGLENQNDQYREDPDVIENVPVAYEQMAFVARATAFVGGGALLVDEAAGVLASPHVGRMLWVMKDAFVKFAAFAGRKVLLVGAAVVAHPVVIGAIAVATIGGVVYFLVSQDDARDFEEYVGMYEVAEEGAVILPSANFPLHSPEVARYLVNIAKIENHFKTVDKLTACINESDRQISEQQKLIAAETDQEMKRLLIEGLNLILKKQQDLVAVLKAREAHYLRLK